MATQKRTRLCISLNGEPAAVAAAAAALEALLGTATVQFGPVVPSTRRPGQAHVAGSLWQPAPHDGGALREVAVGYAVDATAVAAYDAGAGFEACRNDGESGLWVNWGAAA